MSRLVQLATPSGPIYVSLTDVVMMGEASQLPQLAPVRIIYMVGGYRCEVLDTPENMAKLLGDRNQPC